MKLVHQFHTRTGIVIVISILPQSICQQHFPYKNQRMSIGFEQYRKNYSFFSNNKSAIFEINISIVLLLFVSILTQSLSAK